MDPAEDRRHPAELSAMAASPTSPGSSSDTGDTEAALYVVRSLSAVMSENPETQQRSFASQDGTELPVELQGITWEPLKSRILLTIPTLYNDPVQGSKHTTTRPDESEFNSASEPATAEELSTNEARGAILIEGTDGNAAQIFSLGESQSRLNATGEAEDAVQDLRAIFGSLPSKWTSCLRTNRLFTRSTSQHVGQLDTYLVQQLQAYVPTQSGQGTQQSVPLVLCCRPTVLYLERTTPDQRSSPLNTAADTEERGSWYTSESDVDLQMSASSLPSRDPKDPFTDFAGIPIRTPP